jgi:hypothetical protein
MIVSQEQYGCGIWHSSRKTIIEFIARLPQEKEEKGSLNF